jgi:hypothetical protein
MAKKVIASDVNCSAVQNHYYPGPMNDIPSVLMNFKSALPSTPSEPRSLRSGFDLVILEDDLVVVSGDGHRSTISPTGTPSGPGL